jgi:hypothetical protein
MPEIRGGYDVLFDNIVGYLEAHAAAENAIDPLRNFTVRPDHYRIHNVGTPGAFVFPTMGSIDPEPQKSANQRYFAYHVNFAFDLIVEGQATRDGEGTVTASDVAAGKRLRYLIQQMLDAVHAAPRDMGLAAGSIAGRPMMRFEPLPPDMQQGEKAVIGARMTLTIGMAWEPAGSVGTALESIYVDASQWQALFEQE